MTDIPEAVHRLTEPWTTVVRVGGRFQAQDFPPLLDMLAQMVTPSKNSRGGGGEASTRSVLDVKALDLLMVIQDVSRSWLYNWSTPVTKDARVDVGRFWARLQTLHTSGAIADGEYTRLTRYPDAWAAQIWDLIEPPMQVPLRGVSCPECDRAVWVNDEEEQSPALLVSYREGGSVQAECRWRSCGFIAVGDRALLELGYHAGATVDAEALKEMGIST